MLEERNWNAMKIGFTELILVVIVAFVVIGPDKLPEYARKFGKMLRELKKYTGAASEEIQKNVVEPLNEIQAPIKEAVDASDMLDEADVPSAMPLRGGSNGSEFRARRRCSF